MDVTASPRRVFFYVGRAAHPLYREQVKIQPDGFTYVPSHPDLRDVAGFARTVARRSTLLGKVKRQAKTAAVAALGLAGHVRRVSVDPPEGTVLVHSAQFLLKDSQVPYVLDFEDVYVFSLYQRIALERPWARKRLLKAFEDSACRYVLPWTETAKRGFLTLLDPASRGDLESRTISVLPAIRPSTERARTFDGGRLRIVFVGIRFYEKGGPEAVMAVRRLRQTHNVELDLVGFVPRRWQKIVDDGEGIRVHKWLSPAEIQALFARSHLLLFPTHIDTFGYVVLEAMAAALPVVAPDHHALPELVEDDVSGLLFPHENSLFRADGRPQYPLFVPPVAPRSFLRRLESPTGSYVDAIAETLARVAEDRHEYVRLSAGALERVTRGPFSVEVRRDILTSIYQAALG